MRDCLIKIARIDNGYLVEYSTGEFEDTPIMVGRAIMREEETGCRYAMTAEETGGLVRALLDRRRVEKPTAGRAQ